MDACFGAAAPGILHLLGNTSGCSVGGSGFSARIACAALFLTAGAQAESLTFADLEGWWSAQPQYANDSAQVVLHFANEEGKPTMRVSLPSIGVHEVSAGTVQISDGKVSTSSLEFPLTYDASSKTLTGTLPEAIVPVHKIPVSFTRSSELAKPKPRSWNQPKPAVKWRTDVRSPVWAGLERDKETGLIFVGTDSGAFHAIDATGQKKWTFETGEPIKARPAVIGDSVFVQSDSGFAYRLDKRSGRERWRTKIDAGSPKRIPVNQPKTRWDRFGSSFVADAQQVYVGSRDNHLYALDLEDGQERWRVATRDMITATPALLGDAVLLASFDGTVRSVAARDGKERWSYDARLPISGDLAVAGNQVLAGSRTYDLISLDARTGKELWKSYYWFSWIESPPVVKESVVYTGSSDATGVFAIDLADGTRRWKAEVPGYAWARVAVDDRIVVAGTVGQGPHPGNREGALAGIERASGKMLWLLLEPPSESTVAAKLDWGFASSPILADGVVYAVDLNGSVYAIEAY